MVKFVCDKCGNEFPVGPLGFQLSYDKEIIINGTCHDCAKLTYGPLTEELVAEALHWCGESGSPLSPLSYYDADHPDRSIIHRQARFVLRLLNEVDSAERLGFPFVSGGERDWLLDLAKKP